VLLALTNLLLPGTGLVLRDRLLAGTALLGLAVLSLAAAGLAPLVATPAFARELLLGLLAIYLAAAAIAGGLWWWWERPRPFDRATVIAQHRVAAAAYLRGDLAAARAAAAAICRAAGGVPGSWRLVELVERAAGDRAAAERAARRATELERRAAEAEASAAH